MVALLVVTLVAILHMLAILMTCEERRWLFTLNPILYLLERGGERCFLRLQSWVADLRNEKKLHAEMPLLIESLRSCLKAGLCLDEALSFSLKKRVWCPLLTRCLTATVRYRSGGLSMATCLKVVGAECCPEDMFAGRFLKILLLALDTGYANGGDLCRHLEKVQQKIQTSFDLQRRARVFSAQMRLQAAVVAAAPVAIALVMLAIAPSRLGFFVQSFAGVVSLFVMLLLYFLGLKILRKVSCVVA